MNKNQFNVITELQSDIGSVHKIMDDEIDRVFTDAMNKIVEISDDPQKEINDYEKLDELKEEFLTELKSVFEKLEKKLYSL